MSDLSQRILETVNSAVDIFAERIANKYDLNKKDLLRCWATKEVGVPKEVLSDEVLLQNLHKKSKKELTALCKRFGLKTTGKKADLQHRLEDKDNVDNKSNKPPTIKVAKPNKALAKKLTENKPVFQIRKNEHGNYEHSESGLIFDKGSQKVIGVQNDNGNVDDLTEEDIEVCNKYKWQYVLPDNLDQNKKDLDDVEVEEIDDDEEEDDSDVEVEEIIEEIEDDDSELDEDEIFYEEEDYDD